VITELNWFERWVLKANHQTVVKGGVIYALKHPPVAIGTVICAQYHTEHVHITDFNTWETTVKFHDFQNLNELVLQIQLFQVEKQFGNWLGWNRYWTYVWYDPVFSLLPF